MRHLYRVAVPVSEAPDSVGSARTNRLMDEWGFREEEYMEFIRCIRTSFRTQRVEQRTLKGKDISYEEKTRIETPEPYFLRLFEDVYEDYWEAEQHRRAVEGSTIVSMTI